MNASEMPNPLVLYVVTAVVVTGLVVWVTLVLLRPVHGGASALRPPEAPKGKLPSHPEITDKS